MNNISISGRLTRDPEVTYLSNGKAMVKVSVAVDNRMKNKETGKRDASFFECVAFDKLAELIGKHGFKGQRVEASGAMESRSWIDQTTGMKRTAWSVHAFNFGFLQWRDGEAPTESAPAHDTGEPPPQNDQVDPFADE